MKTKKEIEILAEQHWDKQPYNEDAYVVGYTQCQEDNKNNLIKLKIYLKELTDEGIIHPDVRDNIISYF